LGHGGEANRNHCKSAKSADAIKTVHACILLQILSTDVVVREHGGRMKPCRPPVQTLSLDIFHL
jgi:hypothetical protein